MFRPSTAVERPQNLRVFSSLVETVRRFEGGLFYYADEKPLGTPKQTDLTAERILEREAAAMRETLNRLARHANCSEESILVLIDQINEKSRKSKLPLMYQHILGRASEHEEMRRIVEPPMHVDSQLSSNIQFADWVATCITRAIDYQLIVDSKYSWITLDGKVDAVRGAFTFNSKLHLWQRELSDLNHSQIFNRKRVVHPVAHGEILGTAENLAKLQKVKAAAERAHKR